MWKATLLITNTRLPGVQVSPYDANRVGLEAYEQHLRSTPEGQLILLRARGKVTWPMAEPHIKVEPATGEWINITTGDESPHLCDDDSGTLIFVDKKTKVRHFGCFVEDEEKFYDITTGKSYNMAQVLCFLVIPDETY